MSKSLRNFIIALGLLSIIISIVGLLNGDKFMEVLGGIVIGASLIVAVCYENSKRANTKESN